MNYTGSIDLLQTGKVKHARRYGDSLSLSLRLSSFRVPEDDDDGVATQEHLANEAILVDGLRLLLPLTRFGHL